MQYKTVKTGITVKQTIKKSIFIGTISPIETVEEAKAFIAQVKKKYKEANHNAFAYRIGIKKEESFFSDDGEPTKTAGMPIHNAIRHAEITNVAIVVTRYFGGVKLGISGLIQAYGETAKYAIEQAEIEVKTLKRKIYLELPYSEIQLVLYLINKFKGNVVQRNFSEIAVIKAEIDEDLFDKFLQSALSHSESVKIKILE
jgi:uncharacterized YigZ family protein